ncbi:uncharacterized protein LOC136041106 [Artemia franciscana]|uniref:uncharacterized protein LOC136041106 n=1 Tax=Artemia franciscana TaxID=6661 RepID=UPI0032D9ED90
MDFDLEPSKCLVFSSVLNFFQYNLERGVEDVVILKSAVDFFELADITKGKKLLWEKLSITDVCPKCTRLNTLMNHLKDMFEQFQKMKTEPFPIIPVFVISSPTEVLCLPAVAYSRLSTKINTLHQTLMQINDTVTTYDLHFLGLPGNGDASIPVVTNQATIVITKTPRDRDNPSKQRAVIDKIAGHECVENIRTSGDRIIVNTDSVVASGFCDSARSVLRASDVKFLERKFYGIAKGIGDSFDLSLFKNCSGFAEATRIGNSRCAKIAFSDQGYSKIVGNSGHFRRQALTKLFSSSCDYYVLFCAVFFVLSNKGDVKRVKTDYYRYFKFLLYLPRSFRNRRLINKYQATDIVLSVEKLSSNLIDEAPICFGPNNHLIRLFC